MGLISAIVLSETGDRGQGAANVFAFWMDLDLRSGGMLSRYSA